MSGRSAEVIGQGGSLPPGPGGTLFRTGSVPAFAIFLVALFDVLMTALLAAGTLPADSGWGAFARDFRTWCFNGDPATGRIEWFFPASLFGESFFLAGIMWLVWGRDIRRAVAGRAARLLRPLGLAAGVILLASAALAWTGGARPATGLPPFPGADLRTGIPAPAFRLTDQDGRPVSVPDSEGRILILTSFYAHCLTTCPAIFNQLKALTDSLTPAERWMVGVVAVTLDPELDTPAALRERAEAQGLDPALFRLATGNPDTVAKVLDRLGMTRVRDSTGTIRHANLILLVDRDRKIAYRFTLGTTQAAWTLAALRQLLRESLAGAARAPAPVPAPAGA